MSPITYEQLKAAGFQKNCRGCHRPFKVHRASSNFCIECFKGRKLDKRKRKKIRNARLGIYPKMGKPWTDSRKVFNEDRDMKCEVCGISQKEQFMRHRTTLAGDHIVPARLSSNYGNPHDPDNQMNLCSTCHGRKTSAERLLFGSGGMLGFLSELRKWNWPMQRVALALKIYGLYPSNLEHLFQETESLCRKLESV